MEGGGILALDIATTTGWAYASPAALATWPRMPLEARRRTEWPGVASGFRRFSGGASHGRLFREFETWLWNETVLRLRPSTVVFEAPLPNVVTSADTTRRLIGMAAIVDLVCYVPANDERPGIEVREANLSTVKLHFAGTGRAKKPDMIAECFARGFKPGDDNEADAIALLDHAAVGLAQRWARAA